MIYIHGINEEMACGTDAPPLLADLYLRIAKFGHVKVGPNTTLEDYKENSSTLQGNLQFWNKTVRIFANCKFGPEKVRRLSVAMVEGEEGVYWFAQILLLFYLNVAGTFGSDVNFDYAQYFDVTSPVDEADKILNCICVWWATEDDVGHSIQFHHTMSNTI